MKHLFIKIRKYLDDRRTRQLLTRIVSVFAAFVVFVTTYALVLPAVTMEQEAACGIEAHQHDDSCYEDVLICGQEEGEDHTHTESCYERTLVCGKEVHTHSAACYSDPVMGGENENSTELTEDALTEFAESVAVEEAMDADASGTSDGTAEAGTEEIAADGSSVNDGSKGDSATENGSSEVGGASSAGGETAADLDTSTDIEIDIDPESSASDTGNSEDSEEISVTVPDSGEGENPETASTDAWTEETADTAGSAGNTADLENTEDIGDTADLENTETVGTTADISLETELPTELISPAVSFEDSIKVPAGRLSTDTEDAGAGAVQQAESTEITVHVDADENTFPEGTTMVLAAAQDLNAVAEAVEGTVDAPKTMGFHAVDISFRNAEGQEIEPQKPVRVSMTSEAIRRAIEDESTAPVVVHVEESQPGSSENNSAAGDPSAAGSAPAESAENAASAENKETAGTETGSAGDNGNTDNTGNIGNTENTEKTENTGESAAATILEAATGDSAQNADLTFQTGAFSVYAIVYTVDFHYEVNGKMYEFSIPGGGFVSLEHVVEVLGIARIGENTVDSGENEANEGENALENGIYNKVEETGVETIDENTGGSYEESISLNNVEVSEATKQFVADVASVEFSSPELVWVGKVDETSTVGGLKEANGLEVQYSAELTEEQIAEINSSTVEAGDWALISVHPFDTEESVTVTMKNGDQWMVKVTDAQIKTEYLSANGSLFEVAVIYGEDAKIPDGASLYVTEYDKHTEEYQFIRKAVLGDDRPDFTKEDEENLTELEIAEETDIPENAEEMIKVPETIEESGVTESGEGTDEMASDVTFREAVLEALDISILDESGEPIEPEAPVAVRIVMKKLPDDKALFEETAAVQHLNVSSGEVQVETVADTDNIGGIYVSENTATADFTLGSFSQFAITYYQSNTRVTVNVHYVDIDGKELNGTTNNVTANWNQSITLSTYENRMTQSGYTYLGAHYGTYSGQVITSLQGTTSSSGSLSNSNYIVEFKNGNNIVARQEYEGSQRQIDVYLVYAPASGYYIQDTIGEDGCLTVYNGTEVVQTGIDQNLFVRWYRSDNGTGGFQEVTQSKILDGNYNVPELGGSKVNVAIDEGADKYYKAEIYKVENNEEVKLAETAVYHVPYYDDVRNGGFETPHNDTKNGSGRYWPSNYQIENGKEGVVWKTTGVGTGDKAGQDIEIPQGAAADGTGANDLGETLRNYCFAFMPEGNQCAELNCEASGALYQDVLTIPGSQIYWSLYHRARGGYDKWKTETDKTQNKETDTMYVVAMSKELAEKYDVTTQAKVLSILNHVNDPDSEFHDVEIIRITTTNQGNGTMEFLNSNYTMTVPPTWFGNLANGQTASVKDSGTNLTFEYGNTDWHYYTGNFSIPKDQYLTRFFFVAGNTASGNPTMGNFLDDICLSDSVPSPNYGQATAIVQKTVKGLDALPENYATRIETTYEVKSYSGITSSTDRNSDYDLYRTQIDEDGKAVSTASWTFPITIGSGGSAAFTNGKEVSPLAEGKTDEIDGYEQTTTWTISKRNTNGEELTVIASGTGKVIPDGELAKLKITEKDVVCIEFINFYQKKQPVSVWKTDMTSKTITSGAVFELYKADEFDDNSNEPKSGAVKVATGTTGLNGILSLGELSQGEYRLLEIKAPDGYILPDAAIRITVMDSRVVVMQGSKLSEAVTKDQSNWVEGQDDDTKQIQVWNNPGVVLPATGGPGTRLIYLLGLLLAGLSGAGLVMQKHRRTA